MKKNKNPLEKLAGKNLVVFDGECVLCSRFFRFLLWADKDKQFSFAIAQSGFGEALYEHFGLKADDYDTNLVIINEKIHVRLHGFFKCMEVLGLPWKALNVFSVLPDRFLDWAYYKIARNRYKIFGKYEACMVPSKDVRERFIHV